MTEVDIQHEKTQLIGPADGTITDQKTIQFLWNEVVGADAYRFQLFHLNNQSSIVVQDTLIHNTKFTDSLTFNGDYSWQVRGENTSFSTSFSKRSFKLNFEHINNTSIELLLPQDNVDLTTNEITFAWEENLFAEKYRFQLVSPSFDDATHLVKDTLEENFFDEFKKNTAAIMLAFGFVTGNLFQDEYYYQTLKEDSELTLIDSTAYCKK